MNYGLSIYSCSYPDTCTSFWCCGRKRRMSIPDRERDLDDMSEQSYIFWNRIKDKNRRRTQWVLSTGRTQEWGRWANRIETEEDLILLKSDIARYLLESYRILTTHFDEIRSTTHGLYILPSTRYDPSCRKGLNTWIPSRQGGAFKVQLDVGVLTTRTSDLV